MTRSPAETLHGFFEEVWNARRLDRFDAYVAPDVAFHPPRGPARDAAQYRAMAQEFQAGFPDLRFGIEALVARDDLVSARLLITGTNDGPFRGRAPTGRRVRVVGQPWCQVREGRIVAFWQLFDELGMLHQLGHVADATLLGHARFIGP